MQGGARLVNWFTGTHPVSATGYGGRVVRTDIGDIMDSLAVNYKLPDGRVYTHSGRRDYWREPLRTVLAVRRPEGVEGGHRAASRSIADTGLLYEAGPPSGEEIALWGWNAGRDRRKGVESRRRGGWGEVSKGSQARREWQTDYDRGIDPA